MFVTSVVIDLLNESSKLLMYFRTQFFFFVCILKELECTIYFLSVTVKFSNITYENKY